MSRRLRAGYGKKIVLSAYGERNDLLAPHLFDWFFDGSKYIDLSGNGNHGTPYGVSRVWSSAKWVWRVVGRYSDGKLHVLVPMNVNYRILDRDNNVLASGSTTAVTDVSLDYSGVVYIEVEV